jgi:hypothetical protein
VLAFFLAHEPLLVLLGHRGRRVLNASLARAYWSLVAMLVTATALGVLTLDATAAPARWAFAVPILPALILLYAACTGQEKTSLGEAAASIAFATTAIPVCAAAGSASVGVAIAIAFAVLFVDFSLAVRVVILRTRAGGNPRAVGFTRRAAFAVSVVGAILAVVAVQNGWLGWGSAAATIPGIAFASVLAAFPPPAARLRRVGWTLFGVSALTSVMLIAAA